MKSLVLVLGLSLLCWNVGAAGDEVVEESTALVLEAPGDVEAEDVGQEISEADVLLSETTPAEENSEASLSEDEIALFQKRSETPLTQSLGGSGATFLTLAVGFALLLGGFILMRRWVRKKTGQGAPLQIKIIGQHYIGPKKSLAVVRVAGESILIGITDHNISCIKALSLLDEELPAPDQTIHFSDSLKEQAATVALDEDGENFSVAALTDIKDRVSSKLRDMKELR